MGHFRGPNWVISGYPAIGILGVWTSVVPNKTFARACDRGIYAIYTPFWTPSDGREREYDPQNMYEIGENDLFCYIWTSEDLGHDPQTNHPSSRGS